MLPTTNFHPQLQNTTPAVLPLNSAVSASVPNEFWSTFGAKLSSILDAKLDSVAKKDDLNVLYGEIQSLREENLVLKNESQQMKNRMEYIEQASKRCNLVVNGLSANSPHHAKEEFSKLCHTVLKSEVNVTSVRKLAAGKSYVFCLNSAMEVENVMMKRRLLKGSNVYIHKDSTADERTKMYNLRILEKNVRKADQNIKIRQGFARIFIDDKPFLWIDGKYAAAKQCDADFLRSLLQRANFDAEVIVKLQTPRNKNFATSSSEATLFICS